MKQKDGNWGILVNGSDWNGLVGSLQREEGDLSFGLTPHPGRDEAISFSVSYFYDRLSIVSSKHEPLSRHMAILSPFSGE